MIALRRTLRTPRQALAFAHSLDSHSSSGVAVGVLQRVVIFGLGSSLSVRFGHFDYLKEDSDDEYKKVHPADRLNTDHWMKSETLADKLACEEKVVLQRDEEAYQRNNAPPEEAPEKWSSWMKLREGKKKDKFDPEYSSKRFFAEMDFTRGGTIPDDRPDAVQEDQAVSMSTLNELGKGSATGARLFGDGARMPDSSDRFDQDVGFERLPNLSLGRQYDTGLRFDRTRPTLRKDRYATAWSRPDIEPRKRTDGSYDTRPILEFDMAKTEAVRYLGGVQLQEQGNSTTTTEERFPKASDSTDSTTVDPDQEETSLPSDDGGQPGRNFVNSADPFGAYSRSRYSGIGFRYMSSWEQVYEAFKNISGDDQGQDISQAFFAMKQMKPGPPRAVLEEMADAAIQHARELMPISLTNILHTCAKLRFLHMPLLLEWQQQLQDPRVLEACTDLDITSIIYSFGVLHRMVTQRARDREGQKWEKGLDEQFVEKLAAEAVHPVRMENYSHSMLVNILYGLSLMKLRKNDAIDKLLSEITKETVLPRLEIQNISAAIYAIGYQRYWVPEMTTRLLREAVAHISDFPTAGIANMMWSLGNLRFSNLELVSTIAKATIAERHLRNYEEQDLTSVLYGMAMSRYRDPVVIGELVTEIMRPGRITQMQDNVLVNLLSSFSSLRYSNRHLFDALINELSSPKRLKRLKNMHIANVFYGLGACRYENPDSLQMLMDEVLDPDRLTSFSDFDIASVVQGTGSMGIDNTAFVSSLLAEACQSDRIERHSAQSEMSLMEEGLANIVNACSILQYRDEEILTRICHELSKEERMQRLTPSGISLATFALCRLQFYDSKFFSEFLKECTTPQRIASLRPSTLVDLMFGSMRSDVVHFVRFMEVVKMFRSPNSLKYLLNFPFVRLISIIAIQGLRDDLLLSAIKDEILRDARRHTFTHTERRDMARSFERLGFFDDELCAVLNYGRRVQGQSIGILAPGGLRKIEREEKQRELQKQQSESNLDWSGQLRPTFYDA